MTPDLSYLRFHDPQKPSYDTYAKQTLLRSPVITNFFPAFKVSLSKPLEGLISTSINDEDDQTLHAPQQDSYFGESDDMGDDMLWEIDEKPQEVLLDAEKFTTVKLVVKTLSLCIDNVEFPLNVAVRASTVVSNLASEDSLLLSLQLGFTLLVRLWKVPRNFSDAQFASGAPVVAESPTSHVIRPSVVQWWNTQAKNSTESLGLALHAHPSGAAVVSTSPASLFRIHMCQQTQRGLMLLPHFNVPVDGVILHSCFGRPVGASNHIVFLTLTFSTNRRLQLTLYNWYAAESLAGNLEKCSLPLNASFPIPVMIVLLANNDSFLLVCADTFVIVTLHNIISADYSFTKFAYDGSFPAAYFIPQSPILSLETDATDEILLASDTGVIYSITVKGNTSLECVAIARLAAPVSVFHFTQSPTGFGYILNYASDTGGAKELYIPRLLSQEAVGSDKIAYSEATLLQDYKNWSPIVDVLVIDLYNTRSLTNSTKQELWALTGTGRRTKLTQLRSGYAFKKEHKAVEALRKTTGIFRLQHSEREYLACSSPYGTRLLEYMNSSESNSEEDETSSPSGDILVEIETNALVSEAPSLYFGYVPECNAILQITKNSISLTNLEKIETNSFHDKQIIMATALDNKVFLFAEANGQTFLEVLVISQDGVLETVHSSVFPTQVSMMKCFRYENGILLVIGNFRSQLLGVYYTGEDLIESQIFDIPLDTVTDDPGVGFVPHDAEFANTNNALFVGSKSGQFLQFRLDAGTPKLIQFLNLGVTPVTLHLVASDHNLLFVIMRSCWLFNFYCLSLPLRVSFDEKSDKSISLMVELPTVEHHHVRFAVVREDGLVVASVFTYKVPLVKQLSIGEPAKKLIYLDTYSLFVIMCKSKDVLTRLKFADRKTNRMLPTVEVDSRLGAQRTEPIFQPDEYASCAMVWRVRRQGRISKKVIIGTSKGEKGGSIKILDISKIAIEDSDSPVVKIVELISILRDEPVSCIQQIDSTIFFSSGCKIYSTSYSLEDKKLRPVQEVASLSSDLVSMTVGEDSTLLVSTKMDSLLAFTYTQTENDGLEDDADDNLVSAIVRDQLTVTFKDPASRSLVSHAKLEDKIVAGDKSHSALLIVDPSKTRLAGQFMYKLSVIPRIFCTAFRGSWCLDNEKAKSHILCVGVNGEVVVFDPVASGDVALNVMLNNSELSIAQLLERLGRPFRDKITGKGFQGIYKPFFDYFENQGKLIDFDMEEILTLRVSNILL